MDTKNLNKFIPLDKSWIIRMGVLDIINGYKDIQYFLNQQKNLGDDLLALQRASRIWKTNEPIDVGESGTLYRLLQFASWKLGPHKKFIVKGTLKYRKIIHDPRIINLKLKELLKLDSGTSQWASASVLLGNKEKIIKPPYKLKVTFAAVNHWKKQKRKGLTWEPRYDQTILNQAKTFFSLLKGKKRRFIPEQAEDYCFSRVFNYISPKEAEQKWPSLRNHESNRILEMEKVIAQTKTGKVITSRDHRVIQAITMWSLINQTPIQIKYPKAVDKSWPQFWNFIKFCNQS